VYVRHLGLRDFRSWANVELELSPGRTVFVGPNGYGKTNLVEALWYSSTLGSHRVATDAPLVRTGAQRAVVSTIVVSDGRECAVDLEITAGRANKARLNRSPVRTPREILGVLRAVLFAPEDLALVRGDPAERRRYLDDLATVRRPRVAAVRADYEKVLRQRTALLKSASGARFRGDRGALDTLDVWDGHLAAHGAELMAARMTLVNELAPEVQKSYQLLAPASRPASISYHTSLDVEPNSSAGCVWSVLIVTTWSCGWVRNPRKALPATVNRGRWRWRCDWRRTNCYAPMAATRFCCSTTSSPSSTRRDGRRWPRRRPQQSRCW